MDRLETEAMEAEDECSEKQQPPKKFYAEWCRFILDLLLFYTTAFFVLLAVFSLFALVFLVPFFIDPAWSTLQADFDPMGTQCRTISGDYLEGKKEAFVGHFTYNNCDNYQPFKLCLCVRNVIEFFWLKAF